MAKEEKGWRKNGVKKERGKTHVGGGSGGGGVCVKEGNLISVLIKPNLFWRVTETAPCRHADLGRGEGPVWDLSIRQEPSGP